MDAVTLEQAIRTQLSGGNALGANDLAAKALEAGADSPAVRYLFLRSLAESGGARLALSRYEELAPPAEARNEDWLALPGRLHKDLAFSGVQPDENLRRSLLVFEDKSLWFVLSQWIGTILMGFVLFVVAEGILRGLRSTRAQARTMAAE